MKRIFLALAAAFALGACGGEAAPPDPPSAVPLIDWVASMVTNPDEPDTVEDKIILDTDDEAAFDSYLAE